MKGFAAVFICDYYKIVEKRQIMNSISLKMPVTIKAKVTEKLKEKMLKELEEGINRAELEMQQLGIQEKRVLQENGGQSG